MSDTRIGFAPAIKLIMENLQAGPVETVATHEANGRLLARDVSARRAFPPFDMSAMDGYAIEESQIAGHGERRLRIGEPLFAGDPVRLLSSGEAMPIFTGAAVPRNAGAVLIKERATCARDALILNENLDHGANIRRAGEDARAGEMVLAAGARINPAVIGGLSCYGIGALQVRVRPKIAVLVLGDELTSVETPEARCIIDANGPMVAASLVDAGCTVIRRKTIPDDTGAICDALLDAISIGADMVITTGGASVGARDYVRHAVERIGAKVHFHGVHMRPGKPVLFAQSGAGVPIFGLPGNPVSALVGTRFFVMAALRAFYELSPELPEMILADECEPGPTRLLKAARAGLGAHLNLSVLPGQQSHMMRPLLIANSWLVRGGSVPSALFPLFDDLSVQEAKGLGNKGSLSLHANC